MKTSNWLAGGPSWLRVGETVFDKADERHIGKVRRIMADCNVLVEWIETGWFSNTHISQLKRARMS